MIGKLFGTVWDKSGSSITLRVNDVGYQVFLTRGDIETLAKDQSVELNIYHHIREDTQVLYGFIDDAARALFTKLLSVSGVGPKMAMGILSSGSAGSVSDAIATGDPVLFKGVAGVGPKLAERIVVDLKGKVAGLDTVRSSAGDSVYQALLQLGYSSVAAAQAVASLPSDLSDDKERLKLALKGMAND
jgi:Holliday junction DNA helicase RuvA